MLYDWNTCMDGYRLHLTDICRQICAFSQVCLNSHSSSVNMISLQIFPSSLKRWLFWINDLAKRDIRLYWFRSVMFAVPRYSLLGQPQFLHDFAPIEYNLVRQTQRVIYPFNCLSQPMLFPFVYCCSWVVKCIRVSFFKYVCMACLGVLTWCPALVQSLGPQL